jgi:hypothetical protein
MEGDEFVGGHLRKIEILKNAAPLVGLSAVTGGLLFNDENIQCGILFLDLNGACKSADAAADNQNVTAQFILFIFHVFHPLPVTFERLKQPLAGIIGNYADSFLFADALAVEAVLTVFNILENRLFLFGIPTYDIDKASLVAESAAHALLWIKFNLMFSEDRRNHLL